jgi:TolA-binding protein
MAEAGTAFNDLARTAYIRTADIALARGDREAARKTLEDAEAGTRWKRAAGDEQIEEGNSLIAFEQHLRAGNFAFAEQQIEAWTSKTPTAKLGGLPAHMLGRVRIAEKRYAEAIREFERALKINPSAPFADELFFWMGEARAQLGEQDKARECWTRLVEGYPESGLVDKARKKLGEIK